MVRTVQNVILTKRVEEIIERMPPEQQTLLAKANGEAWDSKELAKEVMTAARKEKLVRPELRFNDLRGSKATERVWAPNTSIGDATDGGGATRPRPHDQRLRGTQPQRVEGASRIRDSKLTRKGWNLAAAARWLSAAFL